MDVDRDPASGNQSEVAIAEFHVKFCRSFKHSGHYQATVSITFTNHTPCLTTGSVIVQYSPALKTDVQHKTCIESTVYPAPVLSSSAFLRLS